MKLLTLSLIAFLLSTSFVAAKTPYKEFYAETAWSNLTGYAADATYRDGVRAGQSDYHLFVRGDWYDTHGTNLPFEYSARGTTVGVGYRYWFPGNKMYGLASVGETVEGNEAGHADVRAGFAGYNQWENGKRLTDMYGDLTYVNRAHDTFLDVRYRPGIILRQDAQGRLWSYGVGQVLASGTGEHGTENRAEAGIGIGYIYKGRLTANVELRAGYSFRGTITDRSYFNPTVVVAGGF